MSRAITTEVPDEVHDRARDVAQAEGIRVEDAFQFSLRAFWLAVVPGDTGLESDVEKRGFLATSKESTEWWATPADREWEQWQPSLRAT